MTVVGWSYEGCLLIAATEVMKSTVVLDMGCEGGVLTETELTRNLRIGTAEELTRQVDIDEILPGPPFVGLELFEGDGDLLTVRLFIGIDVAAEVVMNLYVLGTGREGCYSHQGN